MTILYLLTTKPDGTIARMVEEQKKTMEVEVVALQGNKEYEMIVDCIVAADKVISW